MTNYNDGYWHVWNGGECPVHEKSRVDITYAHGTAIRDVTAGRYGWNSPLMFRVVEEHREPREFWISLNNGGIFNSPQENAIHVREVIE